MRSFKKEFEVERRFQRCLAALGTGVGQTEANRIARETATIAEARAEGERLAPLKRDELAAGARDLASHPFAVLTRERAVSEGVSFEVASQWTRSAHTKSWNDYLAKKRELKARGAEIPDPAPSAPPAPAPQPEPERIVSMQPSFVDLARAKAKAEGITFAKAASALSRENEQAHEAFVASAAAAGRRRAPSHEANVRELIEKGCDRRQAQRVLARAERGEHGFLVQARARAKANKTTLAAAMSSLSREQPELPAAFLADARGDRRTA